jgi:hypothetical protein
VVLPSIWAQFLFIWLEALHYARDTELVVRFGAIERTDYKVYNAQMIQLFPSTTSFFQTMLIFRPFLFFLDLKVREKLSRTRIGLTSDYLIHEFLGDIILAGHNIGYTEVRKNHGGDIENGVCCLLLNDWLIIADGLFELVLLHEKDVGHIQFPGLVVATEFGRLLEDSFDLTKQRVKKRRYCYIIAIPGHSSADPNKSLPVTLTQANIVREQCRIASDIAGIKREKNVLSGQSEGRTISLP